MTQVRSITAADFASDCPVPLDVLGRVTRAESEELAAALDGIPEATRARLAVWLYGRSHTHEAGVRVAVTCEDAALRRVAGFVGGVLHDLSRRPYEAPSHGTNAASGRRRISLGGARVAA
ncbi:hypothetical protein Q8W71_26045 [Methylobacterium sp. NEAU 140]|uniref:hypothetical protein n=1 Tax=Methylobacterium sp. NEAU 140 TaxID=3064945 RepID=UPI0027329FD3|nr:hypothetical protein [Methylobacterium sp. NEAU 140]MDP4026095.1 hypothetical protein [Methylobacterium sp. NEAU 140]